MNFYISITNILQAISALIYTSSDFILLVKIPEENELCRYYFYTKHMLFYFSVYCAFAALWLQVHAAFYQNNLVQQNIINKCFYYVHILLLPSLFVLLLISMLSAFIWPNIMLISHNCECTLLKFQKNESSRPSTHSNDWIFTILFLIIKICLLISLVIPLYLHRRNMIQRGIDRSNSIYDIIKRVAIVTTASFTINVTIYFIVGLIGSTHNVIYKGNIFTAFMLLLLLNEVVLSFANWRERLFSFSLD